MSGNLCRYVLRTSGQWTGGGVKGCGRGIVRMCLDPHSHLGIYPDTEVRLCI